MVERELPKLRAPILRDLFSPSIAFKYKRFSQIPSLSVFVDFCRF